MSKEQSSQVQSLATFPLSYRPPVILTLPGWLTDARCALHLLRPLSRMLSPPHRVSRAPSLWFLSGLCSNDTLSRVLPQLTSLK